MGEVVGYIESKKPIANRRSRGELLLDHIRDEVHFKLSSQDDDGCWHCGGEGYTFDCIDGCCVDAEAGCALCSRRCPECAMYQANITKAVRVEVLRMMDIGCARAWAASVGRASDEYSDREVLANLYAARVGCDAFTDDERAGSACWVEGLL